jgi:hypothetical protein
MVKSFIWRVQNIPAGITEDEVLALFREPDRLRVTSLCPDLDRPTCSVATVEYHPPPDEPTACPELIGDAEDDFIHRPRVERNFLGFTPLYHPKSGSYDVE